MSESLSLPKIKLISPEKKKLYYEKILSETPPINNSINNKLKKNQLIKKSATNANNENIQITEAICNIIDLINDNNLNIFYKEDNSNFKRNIDQLNLKFYLETEKIISSNQNKTNNDTSFNSNKLFLILFKQINLYIKEIERLNSLMISSVKDADNMKKKMAIFIKKQNDFETKEQIIQTLKSSVSSLEKKLSNVLLSENNLRQEIQRLQKEKNFYYEYYKTCISSMNNNNKSTINAISNKSISINDLKQNTNNKAKKYIKHNTKDYFFRNSRDIILLNDYSSINDHKRNNSENDYPSKNNNKMPGELQKYCNGSPKKKAKNILVKNNGNSIGPKSIIRLCNYYSHNIEIDIPLGFKSKSPGKATQINKGKEVHFLKGRNTEKRSFQRSTVINENKLDLNIVNNNNTYIFDNSFMNRNKTISNSMNQNKDLSISKLFKNKANTDKSNGDDEKMKNDKKNSYLLGKESKEIDNEISHLNDIENLLTEIKDYLSTKNNSHIITKKNNSSKIKNIPTNKNIIRKRINNSTNLK
jgi:hypothetical protein